MRHIPPLSLGQPNGAFAVSFGIGRRVNGRHKHVVSEHVFVLKLVGIVLLRPVIIERSVHAHSGFVGLACSSIKIGENAVTLTHRLAQLFKVAVFPDAAFQLGIVCGMRTEDGSINTELEPTLQEFGVIVATLMTAKVVSPIVIAHIAGIAGKEDFITEHAP